MRPNDLKSLSRRQFLQKIACSSIAVGAAQFFPAGLWAQGKRPLKVGLITDLTGSNQPGGVWLREGTELAVGSVNEQGGIAELYTLELVIEDAKTSTTEAVSAANRLIGRGDISFVIGPMLSNEIQPIQPMFAEAGIPHIIVGSTASAITDKHDEAPLSIRYSPQDLNQVAPLAKYAVNEKAHKKFFTLAVDNIIGRGAISAFEPVLKALGGSVIASEFYPNLAQDFSTLVAKFKGSGADALMVSDGVPTPVIALVNELALQGIEMERLYGSIVFGGPSFYDRVGKLGKADGMIYPWFYDDGSAARSFAGQSPPLEALAMARTFQEKLKKSPGPAGFVQAWGWGAVKLLKQAIERLATEQGTYAVRALDPVRELPQTTISKLILKEMSGSETGPKFQLTFGDEIGFFSCGQAEVKGGPATYRQGSPLLLEDRTWSDDLIGGLCG